MTEPLGPGEAHLEEDLLVEVVLGQADHASLDEVVRHLARCPACRRDYDDLAGAVDLVLPAVPRLSPPPTFEARAMARLDAVRHPSPGTDPTRRAVLRLAVAGFVGLATGAGVTASLVRGGERVTDPPWSAPLVSGDGARVGRVAPSYGEAGEMLVVEVVDGPVGRRYTCRLRFTDGSTEDVGEWGLSADRANSWVVEVPEAVALELVALELVAESGRTWASAQVSSNPN